MTEQELQQSNIKMPSTEELAAMREEEAKRFKMIKKAQALEEQKIKNINNTLVNNQLNIANMIDSYRVTSDILKSVSLDEALENRVKTLRMALIQGLCNFWIPEQATEQNTASEPVIEGDLDEPSCIRARYNTK
jgi:hypothetical protein